MSENKGYTWSGYREETSHILQLMIQITKNIETEIIQEIIKGYSSCMTFFLTYTNKDYEIHTKAKREFLITLCQSFYIKFKDHSEYFRVKDVQKFFQSNYYIPLIFGKNKDINVTPVSVSGLAALDDYIKGNHNHLHLFSCKNEDKHGKYELMGYVHLPRNHVSAFFDKEVK
ncbi:MAG: hypothetical protein HeimC3_14190 [Candidatus Heimdallarchaeota archaeon LC_3]|nr:MAG: hypothetical protein HeimC3_14190 [Candidatus Heimdallarchaeota archaeon LC_3]